MSRIPICPITLSVPTKVQCTVVSMNCVNRFIERIFYFFSVRLISTLLMNTKNNICTDDKIDFYFTHEHQKQSFHLWHI